MDISKASNFERFVFDLVGRDPAIVRALWQSVERDGGFDLAGTAHWTQLARSGFVSGRARTPIASRRSATVSQRYGVVVDPHTADGIKVGLRAARAGRAADLHRDRAAGQVRGDDSRGARPRSRRPAAYADLESRPQQSTVLPADVAAVKSFIASHAGL